MCCLRQLEEHLKNYFKDWNKSRNVQNSVEQHKADYDIVKALISETVIVPRIPVSAPLSLRDAIASTTARQEMLVDAQALLSKHRFLMNGEQDPPEEVVCTLNARSARTNTAINQPAGETSGQGNGTAENGETVRTRNARTCQSCHRTDCKGRWKKENCEYKSVRNDKEQVGSSYSPTTPLYRLIF